MATTADLFASWKEEQILDELVHAGLLLSEIASKVDRDERLVQQYIDENHLEPTAWSQYDDDVLRNLWEENKPKDICNVLQRPRPEIAVCIRAYQMDLKCSAGFSHIVGGNGKWTSTGDTYILHGAAAGLSTEEIHYNYFRNTRALGAVRKRRSELRKQLPPVPSNPSNSGDGVTVQSGQTLQPVQTVRPRRFVGDVYEQMMVFHTNLSADQREQILNTIDCLEWPANMQLERDLGPGTWNSLTSTWPDADNKFLVALRGEYNMSWKEVADTFFVDRLEEELEKQYRMLLQGGDADNSIELD